MTEDQVTEAIKQVKVQCDLLMATYEPVSMRGALYSLGYSEDDADTVIRYVADHGFDYCLDPMIAATHYDPNNSQAIDGMVTDRPSRDACHWGPDQLKSRLNFIR